MLTPEEAIKSAASAGLAPAALVIVPLDRPGDRIAIDANHYYYPASMIKTPLALAAFTLVQDGVIDLDETYQITQANMTTNDKESPLVAGYVAPLHQLIELMLTISDNVATNVLFDALGRERATQIVQQRYGLTDTAFYRKLSGTQPLIVDPGWDTIHRNTHSAADCARLFELIARDEVPFAQLFRGILDRQEWNNKLSAGLYPGDRFAHKTGDTDEVTHDGGILDTQEGASYVVVVYTGMPSTEANNAKFGPFMSSIRSQL
jgi:beta-lactamase class A